MILRSWAERLLEAPGPPDVIDLHVKDVVAALLAGLRTSDAQTILQNHDRGADRGALAATSSAIARLSESDDIHLASCVTPGAVVIPIALALSDNHGADDSDRAVAAGYAAGMLAGTAIGGARALARGIWPTLFAAPVMAAVTTSLLISGDPERLAHAIALALATSDGRVGNPAARWRRFADAVLRGIRAAEAAHRGDRGELDRLPEGVGTGTLEQAVHVSIATVGFKPFPIARQGACAVVAFQRLSAKGVDLKRIDAIDVLVPAINVALLNRPVSESDRLSRLCNMGLQLAAAALAPDLLYDPERTLRSDVPLLDFARRVTVTAANDLEAYWPDRWAARVVIRASGNTQEETVIRAPFDHDAPHLPQLLQDKWRLMLPSQALSVVNHGQPGGARYDTLWQQIERRLRTPPED